ncbi:hypothetical protein [Chryseobacterium indoltheticum]|uniref:hypothetical protein n=1 Tax=Chryseobacterium indoltheticum TaxID=254 RepID=UPI003F4956E0
MCDAFFKIIAVIIVLLVGAYAASMYYFVDESKKFTIEKEVDYPLEKVFDQFNNLQNFTRWNNFFPAQKPLLLIIIRLTKEKEVQSAIMILKAKMVAKCLSVMKIRIKR